MRGLSSERREEHAARLFIFQPGEEFAKRLLSAIGNRVMEGPVFDAMICVHAARDVRGSIGVRGHYVRVGRPVRITITGRADMLII